MTLPTSSPARSQAEHAYRLLRDRLIMLEIAPGAPIHEAELMADLGLGRTPVREALKRLESDRLIVTYPRRGTFATTVEISELAEISEVRGLLEPHAAALAARRADDAARQELRAAREEILALPEGAPFAAVMARDMAVHRLIYRAARNSHLEQPLIRLDNLATRIWCTAAPRLPDVAVHLREHLGLLAAIVDGEAERARTLAAQHVRHFDETVRGVL